MNDTHSPPLQTPPGRYATNRFTGYGGSDEATRQQMLLEAQAALAIVVPASNPVISRLREDLDRLLDEVAEQPDADTTATSMARTMDAWARAWRTRALTDLDERVAEMRQVYVIHRGDSFRHLLFLDRQGRHMLAVQPQEPGAELRYRKLPHGTELNDLYGPFARLSDTPRG